MILVRCDKELLSYEPDVVKHYGANLSFGFYLACLPYEMYLLCIDFVNKPKIAKNSSAEGVQAFVEYYFPSGMKIREIYGRWIEMPELDETDVKKTHRYVNIPSDGYTKKD